MLGQVELLEDKYFDWTHEQVDRPIRLFKSDFAEMMTKAYWWFVPITWLPVVFASLWMSFRTLSETPELWPQNAPSFHLGHTSIPCLFALGIFIWTFLEYAIHRWLFHLRPPSNSPFLIRLHFSLHGQHHKSPMDSMRLVFPPLPAAVFAVFFFFGCKALFPSGTALAVFAGIVSGYTAYDLIHYYLHHGGHPPLAYFQRLKTYHAHHHYEYQQLGFGISSKMWDYPFGTLIPEDADLKKQ
ncbi:unnamed protein product [Candidula unifasciata]|uniref:Fatty acid hydroxylase domain-containing protein n=1 Tax=Candidula unifasciata TaxID=100452 RepID=A0A8S3YHU9_9EUPU|nr:unnamed protein product [Candidula unifasciata]